MPHCVKIIRIRSYSVPYFSAFGLNTERYYAGKYGLEQFQRRILFTECLFWFILFSLVSRHLWQPLSISRSSTEFKTILPYLLRIICFFMLDNQSRGETRLWVFQVINPCHATDLFWYPLKASENRSSLMFSGGIKRDQWQEMGWRYLQNRIFFGRKVVDNLTKF